MGVLDKALQYSSQTPSPLSVMAQGRNEAQARQQNNELMQINIASKRRDIKDRENLTPLYNKWGGAASGTSGDAQRGEALQGINRIDPAKGLAIQKQQQELSQGAQQFQKQQLTILKQIREMDDATRTRAHKASAQLGAKAQWAKRAGKEVWDRQGFKGKDGKPVPFEKADSVIGRAMVVKGIFDFNDDMNAKNKTALERDVPFIAKTLGVSNAEALRWKKGMSGKRDSEIRAGIINKLIAAGYEDKDELEQKLSEIMPLITGQAAEPSGAAPEQGGADPAGADGDFSSLWK